MGSMLRPDRKLIPLPSLRLWTLRPPLMWRTASRRCKRARADVISALAVERLRAWKDRRPSVLRSQNGITSTKHRHSSSQRSGSISGLSVTRRSRPYAGMRWKYETDVTAVDHHFKRRPPQLAASHDTATRKVSL